MAGLINGYEIADALIAAMEHAYIDFRRGEIPDTPISGYASLNQLWYSTDIILCHNLEEVVIFANMAARGFFGRDVLGRPSIELVPNNPELIRQRAEAFKKILETGEPEHFKDSPRIRYDGVEIPVTGWAYRYFLKGEPSIGAKLSPTLK